LIGGLKGDITRGGVLSFLAQIGYGNRYFDAVRSLRESYGSDLHIGMGLSNVSFGMPNRRLINRTFERAEVLADEIGGVISVIDWENRSSALDGTALLINTTTLGMTGKPPLDLALDLLPLSAVVNDIVYAPVMTPLLEGAKKRGNSIVDGIGMLLHQARPGFRHWFGVEPEVTDGLKAHVLAGVGQ